MHSWCGTRISMREIYRLIMHREVPNIGFEEETIYANIERSSLMKIATRPELFPCLEVIGWILPRATCNHHDFGECW